MIRIIATADNHLSRYYDRLTPRKLLQRRQYLRDGFSAAVEDAIAWQAQIFCICGDLFDSPDPRNVDRDFVAQSLARLREHDIQICAIGGNHDTPHQVTEQDGMAPATMYQHLGALHYFGAIGSIVSTAIEWEGARVVVGGLTTDPNMTPGGDPLRHLHWRGNPNGDPATGVLLLLHGQYEAYKLPGTSGPVFTRATLRDHTDAELIVMGDIHNSKTFDLGDNRHLIIPGSTERMTFGEHPDVPGFFRIEFNSAATGAHRWKMHRQQLRGQPRAEITVRVADLPFSGSNDAREIAEYLIQRVLNESDATTLARLELHGSITREHYHQLDLRAVADHLHQRIGAFTLDTSGLVLDDNWSGEQDVALRGVRLSQTEELTEVARERRATTDDPAEQEIIESALQRILSEYHDE